MKNRVKKILGICLVLSMIIALSGCMYTRLEVDINEDCSGSATMFSGYAEDFYEGYADEAEVNSMDTATYNGVTYYGVWVDSEKINNLDGISQIEFNKTTENGESTQTIDTNFIHVEKIGDEFRLSFHLDDLEGAADEDAEESYYNDGNTTREMLDLIEQVYVYNFPVNMYQIDGDKNNNIEINGGSISINLVGLLKNYMDNPDSMPNRHYVFSSNASGGENPTEPAKPVDTIVFKDVKAGDWFSDAVTAMSKGGLVEGIGNGEFNPNGQLTIAQFCQIVTRACGVETGANEYGYWAGKAIEFCIKEGFIKDLGAIIPEYYDKPINREMAIAGMYRASEAVGRIVPNNLTVNTDEIPDYKSISDEYKYDIEQAYRYNITSGMDEKGTFNPDGILTRSQICQLFYNVNWTTAE